MKLSQSIVAKKVKGPVDQSMEAIFAGNMILRLMAIEARTDEAAAWEGNLTHAAALLISHMM